MANLGGSINAWCPSKSRHPMVNWDVCQGHQTPFSAMTHLLRIWPGRKRTYECTEEERHKRIMELVSGYPLIKEGKRPLDEPLTKDAQLSFALTSFFDQIFQNTEDRASWHSMTTYFLHLDLNFSQSDERQENFPKIQACIVRCIREHSTYGDLANKYSKTFLHPDEIDFLTEAHSQHTDSRHYWPEMSEGALMWPTIASAPKFFVNEENSRQNRNFLPHTVRFGKIQDWLEDWGLPEIGKESEKRWIAENAAQKMLIGASTFLDATGSALRTRILQDRGAGSIIIDGGGRISYLAVSSIEEEKAFLKDGLRHSLTLEQLLKHPYYDAIKQSARKYIPLIEPFISQLGIPSTEYGSFSNAEGDARKEFYDRFTSAENVSYFLPNIHYSERDPSSEETQNRPPPLLDENHPPAQCQQCCLCRKTSNDRKTVSTPSSIMRKLDSYVCFFHFLLYDLGSLFQLRQKGNSSFNDGVNIMRKEPVKIRHLVKFDGNSIGAIFKDFRYHSQPKDSPSLVNYDLDDVENLYFPIDLNLEMEVEEQLAVTQIRHNSVIRVQRRSMIFNAIWWQAMYRSLRSNGIRNIIPWILAGDDVLLANESTEHGEQEIRNWLFDFVNEMVKMMPGGFPISVAGACHERKRKESIISMYQEVSALEKIASYAWKNRHKEAGGGYLSDDKLEKLAAFNDQHGGLINEITHWILENPSNIGRHANHMESLFLTSAIRRS